MAFRYRSPIRLARGLRINLSKSGASFSVGRPGATVNLGKRGVRATVGLPDRGALLQRGRSSGTPGSSVAPARSRPTRRPFAAVRRSSDG